MGFALAQAAAEIGADVTLIAGPVALETPAGVKRVNVLSAEEMLEAALAHINCDVFIGTAAVADYRPANAAPQKLKKDGSGADRTIELVENPDIIATVSTHKNRPKAVIAFAAETQAVEEYARKKLVKKSVDAVVANDVSRADIGFGSDQNEIILVTHDQSRPFGPASKKQVAHFILEHMLTTENTDDA
jgi:phosphopantothenoylcysteine decarboxylase/phosphopantothenate--cysteine ligase